MDDFEVSLHARVVGKRFVAAHEAEVALYVRPMFFSAMVSQRIEVHKAPAALPAKNRVYLYFRLLVLVFVN
jgi:hypothetical protein